MPETDATEKSPDRALIVLLVRHGETAWNAEARLQGQTDIPLSDAGRAQARRLGERLARAWAGERGGIGGGRLPGPPDAVYASDLSRARETADIALALASESSPGDRSPLTMLPALRERWFGKFEGLTAEEAHALHPGETHHEAGEPHAAVYARMRDAVEQIWDECARPAAPDDRPGVALVAGHGGSLRLLLAWAVGLGHEGGRHFHLDNTGLCVLEMRGAAFATAKRRLLLINDTAHLGAA